MNDDVDRIEPRSVVVTGTGQGIGRAIAARLSADGWYVVGVERSPQPSDAAPPVCDAVIVGDTRDNLTHQEAAAAARDGAPLAGWVNNAGITRTTPLHRLDEATVREVVDINGLGYIWGSSAAVSTFIEQRSAGSIVNIGSIHGRLASSDHAAYEFTKGGVDALSRSVAVTYGPLGIRANTVAPGGVSTPHLDAQIRSALDPELEERGLAEGPPLRRVGAEEEISAVVAVLLSEQASYISGQSIGVDGAWSAAFGDPQPEEGLRSAYGLP